MAWAEVQRTPMHEILGIFGVGGVTACVLLIGYGVAVLITLWCKGGE